MKLGKKLQKSQASSPANGTKPRAKLMRYRKRLRIASDSSQQKMRKPSKNHENVESPHEQLDRGCVSRFKKRELSLAYESESFALALR